MDEVLNLYKNRGETPLECIHRWKMLHPEYANLPMTYAGRLDPLAEGVLIVLAGSSVHDKEAYLSLPKMYEVEVIFGVSTDTYDSLGLVQEVVYDDCNETEAEGVLQSFVGRQTVEYPPYSSKPIKGEPMFVWARRGELNNDMVPKKEIDIYSIECVSWAEVSAQECLEYVQNIVGKVRGDFRQEAILTQWEKSLAPVSDRFKVARIIVSASSGAYMRSLAHEWGKKLGLPALALHIFRTKVGDFDVGDSLKF